MQARKTFLRGAFKNSKHCNCGRFLWAYYKYKKSYVSLLNNRKSDLILIMTPEKQDKTLELSKHWSADSTPARNEVIMKRTYPVKSVKCDKICSNH